MQSLKSTSSCEVNINTECSYVSSFTIIKILILCITHLKWFKCPLQVNMWHTGSFFALERPVGEIVASEVDKTQFKINQEKMAMRTGTNLFQMHS